MNWLGRLHRLARRLLREEAGFSLPELLLASLLGTIVLAGVVSVTTLGWKVNRQAEDASALAGDLAIIARRLDRDAMNAAATAPARSQTASVDCATTLDLGFNEGGASVRYRTVSAASDGPLWLQRTSGGGTITVGRHISACTWQATSDSGGRVMLRIDLALSAGSDSVSQALRLAPRLW